MISFENDVSEMAEGFHCLDGALFYRIPNVDRLKPFMMTLVSASDYWGFLSSMGGVVLGRRSAEYSLFPYETVDKLHRHSGESGGLTIIRCHQSSGTMVWQPWAEVTAKGPIQRHLYKSILGDRIRFEEVHLDLQLSFQIEWSSTLNNGLVRRCWLRNTSGKRLRLDIVDGVRNILPAGVSQQMQSQMSCLVDAYKLSELSRCRRLACFSLAAAITDRADAEESLHATIAWAYGDAAQAVMLSEAQLDSFGRGAPVSDECLVRGERGAFLNYYELNLDGGALTHWALGFELNQSAEQLVSRLATGLDRFSLADLSSQLDANTDLLQRKVASADGWQQSGNAAADAHHSVITLANLMRGGVFNDQMVPVNDFAKTLAKTNREVHARVEALLERWPESITRSDFLTEIDRLRDLDLERIAMEYLPLIFSRRHGDPSRPWNRFSIETQDGDCKTRYAYEGNWRDIFQNWEALAHSYPSYTLGMIARFVNASTIDGYNPYRITKEGIDWERPNPEEPWANIGYWGDHQIIYLLKLIEWQIAFDRDGLLSYLDRDLFTYADVPYRLRPYSEICRDPKDTITFDACLDRQIDQRVAQLGGDGRLLMATPSRPHRVGLLEKLLVPVLAKLANFVPNAGIWLNTQRPEWNDANNALVGQGVSAVTLYYLHRALNVYVELLKSDQSPNYQISGSVKDWLVKTLTIFGRYQKKSASSDVALTDELGQCFSDYRQIVYQNGPGRKTEMSRNQLIEGLQLCRDLIAASIENLRRDDELYASYFIMERKPEECTIQQLGEMLEGQVAALSSGALSIAASVKTLEALFASPLYCRRRQTFLLYPDRAVKSFLNRGLIAKEDQDSDSLLGELVATGDQSVVLVDRLGQWRFHPDLVKSSKLEASLKSLAERGEIQLTEQRLLDALAVYERTFKHHQFTGRSSTMFAYEGLGSVFWHMVAKLQLAVAEIFWRAWDQRTDTSMQTRIFDLYYKIKAGFGHMKSAVDYGAFPMDPHSHSPSHAGAQQPLTTGAVKEEILARFLELGVRLKEGQLSFSHALLADQDIQPLSNEFRYLDLQSQWRSLSLGSRQLAFTVCQLPVIYHLNAENDSLEITWRDGKTQTISGLTLDRQTSLSILDRRDELAQVMVSFKR